MKNKTLIVALTILISVSLIIGCGKKKSTAPTDEDQIKSLLESSAYEGGFVTDDGTTTPYQSPSYWPTGIRGVTMPDTLPQVHFCRRINPDSSSRTINVQIPAPGGGSGTALVTITRNLVGLFYVEQDPFDGPPPDYTRSIHDVSTRKIYLEKMPNVGWRIVKISPAEFVTQNPPYTITINQIEAWGSSGTYPKFTLTTADTLLKKNELPTFASGDEVTVKVSVTVSPDSCWAFLHRWGRVWGHHRQPFFHDPGTTYDFTRTWKIADDNIPSYPAVRHAVVDIIGWQALFGDSTATYNSKAWALPYIVKSSTSETAPE
ncbi:MAG: hypothetical protein AB1393_10775 [Candidatus Edwardsbacteria bacterium]